MQLHIQNVPFTTSTDSKRSMADCHVAGVHFHCDFFPYHVAISEGHLRVVHLHVGCERADGNNKQPVVFKFLTFLPWCLNFPPYFAGFHLHLG